MFSFLKKLFPSKQKPRIAINHDQLGYINFDAASGFWETIDSAIFHSVPGDEQGPDPKAVDVIITKLQDLDKYWQICSVELLSIASQWSSIPPSLPAKSLFKVAAISINSVEELDWEVCFESKPEHKWLYIGIQFNGDSIVANDIST